uniref:Sepiapterin reductase n=1 Tax=Glossina brevipalpis TaxID=37001 RepID=A0A1A9WC54_9MUSC
MVLDLNKKTYFLVTGASRGIGRTLAIEIAQKLKAGSVVVLLARNEDGLNVTKKTIETSAKADILVQTYAIDLSKVKSEDFKQLLTDSIRKSGVTLKDFERAFIVHNAGTVGDVSKRAREVDDTIIWTDYYQTNVFSAIALNVEFFKLFSKTPKLVVNLSSKCGIEPFKSMSFYCSGKAAREMYFRVLAMEEPNDTLVLNYAPGAIDTDMTVQVQNETMNTELREAFAKQRADQTMLTTEQTVAKFLQVLEAQNFKSGDHVDYWD